MVASLYSRNRGTWALSLLIALGAALPSLAFAQSWKINNGRNFGALLPTESRKMPDGGTYLTGGARYLVETEDPSYPITGLSMDCRWMCKIPANNKDVACVNICGGVDKDGDLFSFRSSGGNSYEVGPGSGKFSRATGGGTFESVQPDDPALTLIRWKGTLNLK